MAAPTQGPAESQCRSPAHSVPHHSRTGLLSCSGLGSWTFVCAPWSQCPEHEACWDSTGVQSTSMPDSCCSYQPEGDSKVTEKPEVFWKAVALDTCACCPLAWPCPPCQAAQMPPNHVWCAGPLQCGSFPDNTTPVMSKYPTKPLVLGAAIYKCSCRIFSSSVCPSGPPVLPGPRHLGLSSGSPWPSAWCLTPYSETSLHGNLGQHGAGWQVPGEGVLMAPFLPVGMALCWPPSRQGTCG